MRIKIRFKFFKGDPTKPLWTITAYPQSEFPGFAWAKSFEAVIQLFVTHWTSRLIC